MDRPNVQPERLNLLSFFQRLPNAQFVIPAYQRNYVWTAKKQVKKFLDDYDALLNKTKDKHFIGIIMYLRLPRGIGFNELSVVDGQQRIVTTFLILHALKELAIECGNKNLAEQITNQYLVNPYHQGDDKLKLKPLIADDDVYTKIISGRHKKANEKDKKSTVYQNFVYIKSFLKERFGKHQLESLLDCLNSFYVVAIELAHDDDAQEIFETINSAGEDLTKADLIRNYLLMNMQSAEQDKIYTEYWYPLEKKFENSLKLEGFFRMFLANQTYILSDMDNIYEDFRKWHSVYGKTHSIEETMKLIMLYANYYYSLFISEKFEIESIVNNSLVEFRKNAVEPTAPILMEVYHLYDTNDPQGNKLVDGKIFAKVIDLFTTYNMRRNICNLRSGVLTRIVPPMLKDVLQSCGSDYKNFYNFLVKYLVDNNKDKASFMPDNEYIKQVVANMNAYALRNYIRTIFERIEMNDNPAPVKFSSLSIEHLMPQTPTKEWLENLKVTREVYDANVHRIGNLTLAAKRDNSKMSNNPFEYKKSILLSTKHLKMNAAILEKKDWNINEINIRTMEIIDKFIKLYPYVQLSEEIHSKYEIFLKNETANISAYIHEDFSIEIQPGSKFKRVKTSAIQELINSEVISEDANGFMFVASHDIANLKEATDLIIENPINEWEMWVDTKNNPLNLSLRTILTNQNSKKKNTNQSKSEA